MKTGQNLILNISLMGDGLISFNITGIGNYSIGCVFDGDSDYKSTNVTQNVSVIANVVQDGNNGFKDTSNQKIIFFLKVIIMKMIICPVNN